MAIESDKLADIFRQINEQFSSHNEISVIPVKGDPPNKYEITYTVPGMTLVDGEQILKLEHVVELTIPFGFPHFSPSCKAKSDIFHPDFDPGSICLGDFWDQEHTVPELIIHIGRMISGEFYSTDNTFNEPAAIWYTQNQEKLPFSKPLSPPATDDQHNVEEIFTMDDSYLSNDYDYLAEDHLLDESERSDPEKQPPAEKPGQEIDISLLQLLDRQKRYHKLLETVKEAVSPSKEVEQFSFDAQKAMNTAGKYDKIAQENEEKGHSALALEGYEKAASLVADFPEIDAKITRVQNSLDLFSEISPEHSSRSQPVPKPTDKKKKRIAGFSTNHKNQNVNSSAVDAAPNSSLPFYRRKALLFFIFLQVLLFGGGTGSYLYVKAQKEKLKSADHSYKLCLEQLEADKFTEAKNSCEAALRLSKGVIFQQQQGGTSLTSNIKQVLSSEKLQQGLAGKTFVDGQYLSEKDAEILFQYKKISAEGTAHIKQSQWGSAVEKLQQAIIIARDNSFIDANYIPALTSNLHKAELQILLLSAAEKFNKNIWKEAIESSTVALAYLDGLQPEIQQMHRPQLQKNIAKSRFEDLKGEADNLFAQSDWKSATSRYQQLLLSEGSNDITREAKAAISKNIARAKLYDAISSGNIAFSSGEWDEAITAYRSGQSLLADSKDLISSTDSDITIRKLDKAILQASVIKNRQTAKKFVDVNDLQAAKLSYQKILQQIRTSSFAGNSDFIKISAQSSDAIQSLTQEIFLNEKRLYLETNYQEIFTAHYPAASQENISHPVITMVEETPENLLFKLQCTETNRGRKLFLIIYYRYDKKSGNWLFSSGNQ